MMQIVYFSQKNQFLTEIETDLGEITFITPSPAKADGLRSELSSARFDVITIAKFTSDLMESLWSDAERPKVKRKSELLLIFGILKNKYIPDLGFEQFLQAYNLFSDLRSFSLDQEALASVLEEQSPEINKAVALFWQLLTLTGYLDEHGAYEKIANALRTNEESHSPGKKFIFWGFQHLNGQQVDLLKSLSLNNDVFIPFPLALKEKLKRSDWLSWIKEDNVQEIELPLIEKNPKATWVSINSREISRHLKDSIKDGDQIVLGVATLTALHLDIVPSSKVSYKIAHELIGKEINVLSRVLADEVERLPGFNELEELLKSTQVSILESRLEDTPNFKKLKAIQLYQDALGSVREMTDETIKVDQFFLKLLSEVVKLNQPRTSYVPMSPSRFTIDLKDMSSLEEVKRDRPVLLCIDDRFDEIQSLGQNYTESIQKALGALGPLKRNELELLFKHWEFSDLFSEARVTIYMSETTLKHSLIWKRLLTGIELKKIPQSKDFESKPLVDPLRLVPKQIFEGSFSASKFQTFVDCPRKFYFSYVDKIFPSTALKNDFDNLLSGTIIHQIIEQFFKLKLLVKDLGELTARIMREQISLNSLSLSPETFLQKQLIFNHRAMNGIMFLEKLSSTLDGKIQWRIEQPFSLTDGYKMTGKIDCIGVTGDYVFLLDFKSTLSSASTYKEIESLESLQLWAYAKAATMTLEGFDKKSIVMGFVVLDNPAESNLLMTEGELYQKLKTEKFCKFKIYKPEFSELYKAAENRLLTVAQAIVEERIFPPRPRKPSNCTFCELSKVCVKSELTNV